VSVPSPAVTLDQPPAASRSSGVRVLVTSSRLPHALEEIRLLGRAGHTVFASDTFASAPGSHSKYVEKHFVTAAPARDPVRFVGDVLQILEDHAIDRLMPAFEEALYLAPRRAAIAKRAEPFFPSFEVLRRLHDKISFLALCEELGLRVPQTLIARSRDELAAATKRIPRYFARAALSRGGVRLLTNHGPLAGAVSLDECDPTAANPFIVQEFVEGEDLCTFSVCHHGRVALHASYVHPLTLEHAGGIVFDSVIDDAGLDATRRIAEATGYHGRISLDFLRTERGLVAVECNPRPTAGVTIVPPEMYDDALMDRRPDQTLIAPAGTRRKLSLGILRNMAVDWSEIPDDLEALLSRGKDVYADPKDLLPMLWQFIAYGRVIGYRLRAKRRRRSDLMQGYFYDIVWDGDSPGTAS